MSDNRNIVLSNLCDGIQTIAMQAGAYIKAQRAQFKSTSEELKSFNNLVSYVDQEAEKMIVDALGKLLPEAGFIAEENSQLPQMERYNWIIDPLDGTTNFIHGVPCFAVSIALAEYGKPVAGVIYEINLNECFYAFEGGGAFLNGSRIHVSQRTQLKEALLGTGFPYYDFGLTEPYLRLFADLMQSTRGLRRPGSAATDIAYVACGRFEAFYEYGLHPWDVAAGIILVREAGGCVTTFMGDDPGISGARFVCSNARIHNELLEKIQHHFPL